MADQMTAIMQFNEQGAQMAPIQVSYYKQTGRVEFVFPDETIRSFPIANVDVLHVVAQQPEPEEDPDEIEPDVRGGLAAGLDDDDSGPGLTD